MIKKIIFIFLAIMVFFIHCKNNDYEVNYDDEKIQFGYNDNKIIFENNLDCPVILDNIKINDKETHNFVKYYVCDYIKYKDEVVVNYNEKLNQIIYISSIVLPGKKKEISYTLKKEDDVEIEFYPVNYNFLSDNVYFLFKIISTNEKRYKLYPDKDIKKLDMVNLEKKEEVKDVDGIMIFVKEYEALGDFLEEAEFETE